MTHPEPLESYCDLDQLLVSLGVATNNNHYSTYLHVPVCIDGRVVGSATPKVCKSIANHLRKLKVEPTPKVPPTMEIAWIPQGKILIN